MIETEAQRTKREKGEKAERAARAAAYAEKMKTQLAPKVPRAGLPSTADPNAPLTPLAAKSLNKELHDESGNLADKFLTAKRRQIWIGLNYASWTDYCKNEWNRSKSRIYELINFADTREQLSESAIADLPEKESQTRPMNSLPPTKKKKAWKGAQKATGKKQPTGKEVAAFIETMKPANARVTSTTENLPMHVEPTEKVPQAGHKITDDTVLELSGMVSNRVTEITGQPITESEEAHLAIQIGLWLRETIDPAHLQ